MTKEEDLFNGDENDDFLEDGPDEQDDQEEENDNSDMEVDDEMIEDRDKSHDRGELYDIDTQQEDDGEEEDEEGDDENDENDGEDGEEDDDNAEDREEMDETEDQDMSSNKARQDTQATADTTAGAYQGKNTRTGQNSATEENGSRGTNAEEQPLNVNSSSQVSHPEQTPVKVNGLEIRTKALEAVRAASEFDIVPMVAIPYAQQCHSMAISEGPKWLLTGGEDGFIRKYDFAASIDGKAPLTVAQKHNLMDNINKAGVIGSYWENEQPMTKSEIINENPKLKDSDFTTGLASYEPKTNPVYSLDVEKNGLWCLSGLLSGGISLYTMIYNEGAIHHYFQHDRKRSRDPTLDSGHLDAVSVLRLNYEETAFLSGLWDKTIREWDLNTGKTKNLYKGSTGQISSVQFRPVGLADLTFDDNESKSDVDSLFGSDEEDENGDTVDANISKSNLKTDSARSKIVTEDKIFMSSSIDGAINIWDARISGSSPVIRLGVPDGTPPWCMTASWSNDGDKIYVGRRNSTVDEFSLRMPHGKKSGNVLTPNVLRRLTFPKILGPVSTLSVMPNDNFIFCGSNDNIRLYNLNLYDDFTQDTATAKKRATPFHVIPGHHGGVLSNLVVDETGRFLISTSGNRGWGHAPYADVVLVYSIDTEASQQ